MDKFVVKLPRPSNFMPAKPKATGQLKQMTIEGLKVGELLSHRVVHVGIFVHYFYVKIFYTLLINLMFCK